jgi:hypothetical protein
MPSLLTLAAEYGPRGVAFVAASRDDAPGWRSEVDAFARKVGSSLTSYAVLADDTMAEKFDVQVLPTLVVLDRRGQVLDVHLGYARESELRRYFELAGSSPP